MRAGLLRHKITIEYRAPVSPTVNNMGEVDYAWTTYRTTMARISAPGARGREQIKARALESLVETQIMIRYTSGITAAMRVLHGTQYYDIAWIDNFEERNRMLNLYCSRGASLG